MASISTRMDPAEIVAVVQEEMGRWSVPGLALGVLRDGEVGAWGFGVTSLETGQPVTSGTLFQAGSISKVFTTTLVMQLVDEGALALDEPVRHYLPSLRLADAEALERVTLRHLLSHTAGFYGDRFEDYGMGDDALARAIAEFRTLRQYTPPGALWAYCNTGFQLAGAVAEHALGVPFETAMRERVLRPLGLERTFYFAHEAITYPVAVGHNKLPAGGPRLTNGRVNAPNFKDLVIARAWARPRARGPQGGIITTVGDLLAFARFHLGDGAAGEARVLSDASLRAMQAPQVEAGGFAHHYGLGWALHSHDGVAVVGHGGSTNGFRARLALVPARGVALAVLTNGSQGRAAARSIETWWLNRVAGVQPRDPATITLPPEALARFAGRYEQPGSVTTVTVAGDELQFQTTARDPFTREETVAPPVPALPVAERRFVLTEGVDAGDRRWTSSTARTAPCASCACTAGWRTGSSERGRRRPATGAVHWR